MGFGNPVEKSIDELSQKIDDLKNQGKLADLDTEKRILVLENTIRSVQKIIGSIKDFETTKEALMQIDEMQKKLRDIEDTNLISRLEGVQGDERLALLDESMGQVNAKIKLLSDAVDMLGESIAKISKHGGAPQGQKEMQSLMSEVNSMRDAISKLAENIVPLQRISALEGAVAKIEESRASIIDEFKVLTQTVRERIERMDRRLEQQKNIELPEYLMRDIRSIQAEIGQLKSVNAEIVNQIELSANKIQGLRSLKGNGGDYAGIRNEFDELKKSLLLLRKEMDLDRAMYPENFLKIDREISAIKSAGGASAASSADIKAMAAELLSFATELKKVKEQLPKQEEKINSILRNGSGKPGVLSQGAAAAKSASPDLAELKKSVEQLQKSIRDSGTGRLEADMNAFNKELGEIKNLLLEHNNSIEMIMKRPASAASKDGGNAADADAIARLQEQIDGLKSMEEEIVGLVEANTKKMQGIKPGESAGTDDSFVKKSLEDLGKTVMMLRQEMDRERAMYPESIMRLGREIDAIKKSRQAPVIAGNPASSTIEISALKKELDTTKKSVAELTALVGKTVSFREEMMADKDGIQGKAAQEMAFLRKELDSSKKAIAQLTDTFQTLSTGLNRKSKALPDDVLQELAALRKDVDTSHESIAELAGMFGRVVSNAVKPQENKGISGNAEQEINALKKDLGAAKKSIAEIMDLFKKMPSVSRPDSGNKALWDKTSEEMASLRNELDTSNNAISELANMFRESVSSSKSTGRRDLDEKSIGQIAENASEIDALKSRIRGLEEELLEFKSVAKSIIDENERLEESLKETSYEISGIKQNQPIIID